jgi:hypothetical protein
MSWASHGIRRWRLPALLGAGLLAAGVVIALLQPSPAGYLDPSGTDSTGGHALADLVAARGQQVLRTSAPASASAGPGALELVTSPGLLSTAQLAQVARFDGDILLVAPDAAALRAIAPAIRIVGAEPGVVVRPQCAARPATVAGDAYLDGAVLRTGDPTAQSCYPGDGGYFLIRYTDGTRTVTVLGSSAPLTNQFLADRGDAALCLNLLGTASRIIWLVPSSSAQAVAAQSRQRSFFSLVPWPAYLIAIQLCVAALLAAAWRARRLGPLVAERLPVIVRAAETVEGHGRLYQARRARDRAAGELRAAARDRIARLTGSDVRAEAIAARAGQTPEKVASLLHGPPPATDRALVTLAADLDTLEQKIRQS